VFKATSLVEQVPVPTPAEVESAVPEPVGDTSNVGDVGVEPTTEETVPLGEEEVVQEEEDPEMPELVGQTLKMLFQIMKQRRKKTVGLIELLGLQAGS
jgi:hypothetical protein